MEHDFAPQSDANEMMPPSAAPSYEGVISLTLNDEQREAVIALANEWGAHPNTVIGDAINYYFGLNYAHGETSEEDSA